MKKEDGDGEESKIVVRMKDQNSDERLHIAHGGINLKKKGYAMLTFCLEK